MVKNAPAEGGEATEPLRLAVVDAEDLAVVSAHLQHAEALLGDMAYLPKTKRFALVVDRFDWTTAGTGQFFRRQAGLHFERVLKVARRGLPNEAAEPQMLLAIGFVPEDAPGGGVLLTFAGGGQIRLTVECLEAEMRDMGDRRSVTERPDASLDAAPPIG